LTHLICRVAGAESALKRFPPPLVEDVGLEDFEQPGSNPIPMAAQSERTTGMVFIFFNELVVAAAKLAARGARPLNAVRRPETDPEQPTAK
jgi:hypothetical protein